MEADLTWIKETGLDVETGLSFTGSPDKYMSALQRFYKNHGKNKAKVEEYLAAGDYESYMITVHALKSNAKMIGAHDLSMLFATLEEASRNGETELVDAQNSIAMKEYDDLISKLSPLGDMGDMCATDEISADVARTTADELIAALDDYDDEKAKALAKKLSGYPFRITQADKLKEAIGYIEDFMYDEAGEIVRQIIPQIE